MVGIYCSGTGNSRYALELFLGKYDESAKIFAIEDENIASYIKDNEEIIFASDYIVGEKCCRAGDDRKIYMRMSIHIQ